MKIRSVTVGVVFLVLLAVSSATASDWDKATVVTFSAPVEIPGRVLPAGTYLFKLLNSLSDRNVVQIFNKDETKLIATLLTITDFRFQPTDKTVITFEERPKGEPEAIQAWFYPRDQFGNEFVYPKKRAVELAKRTNQAVLSTPTELATTNITPAAKATEAPVVALKQAPVTAIRPGGEEVEITELILSQPAPVPSAPALRPAAAPKAQQVAKRLPKTASSVPLAGLIGLLCLGGWMVLLPLKRAL